MITTVPVPKFKDRRETIIEVGDLVGVPDLQKDHGRSNSREGFVIGFDVREHSKEPIIVFFGPKEQLPSIEKYLLEPAAYTGVECLAPNRIRVIPKNSV
ncbi:MAG TPA: hypothetical protein VMR73_01100 [Candidatus Paceibacterota bacterium]|nr:hypothetical protein [Candidatus Paceibacterota bacterium]